MPAGKPHKSVPFFSKTELDIANDCAVLLWHGINFATGKKTTSDEKLMSYFAEPVAGKLNAKPASISFDRNELHTLIITAGLKAMLRKKHELSYTQFETYLSNTIVSLVKDINSTLNETEKWGITSAYAREGGKQLVDVNVKNNAGFRVPLSTRILFFATPTLPIANFSNGLAKALNLPLRPEYAVRPLYQIFHDGLKLNKSQLQTYNLPASNGVLDADVYLSVQNSDWWQRRVLDIAMLLKFNVTNAMNPLPLVP